MASGRSLTPTSDSGDGESNGPASDYDDETRDRRVELISDAIATFRADVVGLQEVARSANHGTVAERVAAGLAGRTGNDWSWCFFASNPHVPGEPDDATPDVYVGDFNTLEGGAVWQTAVDAGFVDGFRAASPGVPGFTSGQDIADPDPTVSHRIDYVFARPGTASLALADVDVIGDAPVPFAGSNGEAVVWPSDHYGVAVTVLDEAACAGSPAPTPGVDGVGSGVGAEAGGGSLPATGGAPPVDTIASLAGLAGMAWLVARRTSHD